MKKEVAAGIEFELDDLPHMAGDKIPNEMTRHVFRVPVSDPHGVKALLGGHRYDVINLEKRGISIRLLKGEKPFGIGDILPSIELTFQDHVLNLRGKVVHVSFHEKEGSVCGLRFIDMDEKSVQLISGFYQHLRKQMFSKR